MGFEHAEDSAKSTNVEQSRFELHERSNPVADALAAVRGSLANLACERCPMIVQSKYLPKLGVSICAGTDGLLYLPAEDPRGKIMADAKRFILTSCEITQREQPFSHPWNPKSQLMGVQLSRALGLKRTGVSIARIPSGKESFVYHSHQSEEEWLYILSGRGIAEIDGEEIEIAAGAFIAFPHTFGPA
jgi:mannose-6-phosphate isomerase-like protein (cupin superfamily)